MGGRGGAGGSSNAVGLRVTKNGKTSTYYFYKENGRNYYQQGLGEFPEETPLNMSMSEFKRRVISDGATVKEISATEKRKAEEKRAVERAETNKFLNQSNVSDRVFVKGSRAERTRRRAERRNRKR